MKFKDLSGRRFGMLLALRFVGVNGNRKSVWACKCDCGFEVLMVAGNLTSGGTTCCGCVRNRNSAKRASKRNYRHGHATGVLSPEYRSWAAMKGRCKYPSVQGFQNYGGRGISVCSRWLSFDNFLADMGPRPSPKHSIDRVDVNGNYEPGNCRWATAVEQAANKRPSSAAPEIRWLHRDKTATEYERVMGEGEGS